MPYLLNRAIGALAWPQGMMSFVSALDWPIPDHGFLPSLFGNLAVLIAATGSTERKTLDNYQLKMTTDHAVVKDNRAMTSKIWTTYC